MATTLCKVGYWGASLQKGEMNKDISSEEKSVKGDLCLRLNVFPYLV